MTILVDIFDQSWMRNEDFAQSLEEKIPGEQIKFYPDLDPAEDIKMLACDRLRPGLMKQLPNIKLVQKLGAGVETIVNDADLPDGVRITRLKPQSVAMEMARFCLAFVLRDIHNLEFHQRNQDQSVWAPKEPSQPGNTKIGVLGLGISAVPQQKFFHLWNSPLLAGAGPRKP